MDHVLRHVVIPVGDEDLLAGDQIAAVVLLDGPGGARAHVRTRLGLRQAHRARPLTGVELLAEQPAQLGVAEVLDQLAGSAAEQKRQGKAEVGAIEELVSGRARPAQAQTAELRAVHGADPAPLGQRPVGADKGAWNGHRAVVPAAALAVPVFVRRIQLLLSDLQRLGQCHPEALLVPVRKPLGAQYLLDGQPFEELKLDISQVDSIGHIVPSRANCSS